MSLRKSYSCFVDVEKKKNVNVSLQVNCLVVNKVYPTQSLLTSTFLLVGVYID